MSSKGDSKPGFFKRLFGGGSSKKSGEGSSSSRADGGASSSRHGSSSESSPTKMKPSHSPLLAPPVKTRTSSSGSSGGGGGRSPTAADAAQAERKPRRQTSGGQKKARSQKHRKRTKTLIDPGAIKVNLEKQIEFPTTPEMILAYHKARPFLTRNEEWLLVELNEYECLVDSIDIIRSIAEHSKFFEVEPDELWEEFFEFVDEVPSYDEIINYDVWQEFRDVKYQC